MYLYVMRMKPVACFITLGCEQRYFTADRARATLGGDSFYTIHVLFFTRDLS